MLPALLSAGAAGGEQRQLGVDAAALVGLDGEVDDLASSISHEGGLAGDARLGGGRPVLLRREPGLDRGVLRRAADSTSAPSCVDLLAGLVDVDGLCGRREEREGQERGDEGGRAQGSASCRGAQGESSGAGGSCRAGLCDNEPVTDDTGRSTSNIFPPVDSHPFGPRDDRAGARCPTRSCYPGCRRSSGTAGPSWRRHPHRGQHARRPADGCLLAAGCGREANCAALQGVGSASGRDQPGSTRCLSPRGALELLPVRTSIRLAGVMRPATAISDRAAVRDARLASKEAAAVRACDVPQALRRGTGRVDPRSTPAIIG